MKLLVLGAGTVGRSLAAAARQLEPFTEVMVADLDGVQAATVAHAIGARAMTLDARDRPALVAAMSAADVSVSAIGPSTRFGVSTLEAAIEAGRPYADVCDDPRPTLAMLDLDAQAKRAGVAALIGLGASPGISNMLAVSAGERVDRVCRLLTGWGAGGPSQDDEDDVFSGEVSAALEHWVEQASGFIPVLSNGRIHDVRPLRKLTIHYPGIGAVNTRTIGHPEPVMLKRRFPELHHSQNVMDFSSYLFGSLTRAAALVNRGRSAREGAALLLNLLSDSPGESLFSFKAAAYAWHEGHDRLTGKRWLPALWAIAEGERDSRPVRVAASLAGTIRGGMGPMTGVPAAVALSLLVSGTAPVPGVYTIDTAFEPQVFFNRLRPFLTTRENTVPPEAVIYS